MGGENFGMSSGQELLGLKSQMSPRRDRYRAEGEDRVEVSLGHLPREEGITQATGQTLFSLSVIQLLSFAILGCIQRNRPLALAKLPLEC